MTERGEVKKFGFEGR